MLLPHTLWPVGLEHFQSENLTQVSMGYTEIGCQLNTCMFVSQNTHDLPSWELSKLPSCECTNVFKKEKKIVSLFFVKAKKREREESMLG